MIEQIKFSSLLGLSRPNRSSTTRPNHPMTTRFRPKPKVLSVGDEFPFSKTDTVGSSGGFASPKPDQPKPDQPKPDWSYKKIRPNLAKIGQIRLYLVGFSQIRPNPTISSEKKNADFKKNPVSGENFPDSGEAFFSNFDAFFNSGN